MASSLKNEIHDVRYGKDHPLEDHLDHGRWRHQESGAYARHASPTLARAHGANTGSKDLVDFFNKDRIDAPSHSALPGGPKSKPIIIAGNSTHSGGGGGTHAVGAQNGEEGLQYREDAKTPLDIECGPLLNYRRMEKEIWHGSVLIVTKGGGERETSEVPVLNWKVKGTRENRTATLSQYSSDGVNGHGSNGHTNGTGSESFGMVNGVDYGSAHGSILSGPGIPSIEVNPSSPIKSGADGSSKEETRVMGTRLYSDPKHTFWRFDLSVPMQQSEIQIEYKIPGLSFPSDRKKRDLQHFNVPAITESMRIMFHSCNGFSVGTDEESWSGAALWNDVMRVHKTTPFHVMLGGGDQIYNDGIRVNGPLRPWTDIGNPIKRREYPFPEELRKDCDEYYVDNYIRWYGVEPFASANGQIPQLNLWDDHDIIDGFGSYVDEFMRCSVFRGIGGCANKYYLLFQHHLAPPRSTYTTDAPQTTGYDGVADDPRQLENTFVLNEPEIDSSYIIGAKPGPYVVEHSRSIYARLGARIAFFGIDARTERTRKQVNYPETYEIIFARLREELSVARASSTPVQHLIVLLGIPIAYPRLTWLENIFSSPLIAPIKFLNKRFGLGGGFFNHFDGSVDLLDDLDDHYTAKTHKRERMFLVHQLQALAAEFSVRITILGGDVHLAAVGRFYSSPKLNVPISEDHRYMANIISSAIVNKPPPQAVANLLARRNKLHHLDQNTDETLMKFFDKDPGDSNKTSSSNHVTMPSRNWAMITENSNHGAQPQIPFSNATTNGHAGLPVDGASSTYPDPSSLAAPSTAPSSTSTQQNAKDGHSWLHEGEVDAGTTHKAAHAESHGQNTDGSLDVAIRVEKDQHDKEGKTQSYGMTIPLLLYTDAADHVLRKRDAVHGAINQRI